ncbi:hypothetical protein ACR77U_12705 [Enterococcus faecium]|uniref:hypothetical protein n=1 Tax=Enterococcus faecium TaxID=1352 RepID=UPI003DA31FF6
MADNINAAEGAMGWDDQIENEGQEFILLDDGDYPFTVEKFERGQFPGSAKLSASPKATLTLAIESDKGTAHVRTDLILNRALEWKLCSFFLCVGLKKHGEPLIMKWDQVVGKTGTARVGTRSWTGNDGRERKSNEIERFLDPVDAHAAPKKKAPAPVAEPDMSDADEDFLK